MQHLPTPTLAAFLTGEAIEPLWVSPSGRAFYPIAGGAPDDDPADDPKDDDEPDPADDPKDDKADDKKDWKAEFEAQQRINRTLERKARKDAATIAKLTGKKPEGGGKDSDDEPTVDADKIREQAKADAAREVLHGRIEDKIEAKAGAFADPEDAVAVLLRGHDIEDFIDGDKPDVEAIVDALKELGEKKPHLLAQGGKKFQGDGDGGTRKEGAGRPKNLGDALARHYQKR